MDINISKQAKTDIVLIYNYILDELQNSIAAASTRRAIVDKIDSLSRFPNRSIALQSRVEVKTNLRFIIVKNYLIFFRVRRAKNLIEIIRIIPAMRDFAKILLEDKK